jgi:hypothetical protein
MMRGLPWAARGRGIRGPLVDATILIAHERGRGSGAPHSVGNPDPRGADAITVSLDAGPAYPRR